MSYILDALKRAESERARGLVPGLHAQPLAANRQTPAIRNAAKPALLLLAGVVLALAGVALWRWLNPAPAPAVVLQSAAVAARPAATVAVVPPVVMAPAEIAPAPLPVAVSPAPAVQPAPDTAQTKLPAQGALMAPAQITPETRTSPKPPRPQPATETRAQAKAPAPAPARVTPLAELPSDARLSIPKVVISGSTYSDTPAYRMLIINGQVFHEGEKIAPDMTLEQIRQGSAVLDYKGQRYSVGY